MPPPAEPARDVPPRGDPAPAPDRPAPDVVANSVSVLSLHGEGPPLLLIALFALSLGLLQLLLHTVESSLAAQKSDELHDHLGVVEVAVEIDDVHLEQ